MADSSFIQLVKHIGVTMECFSQEEVKLNKKYLTNLNPKYKKSQEIEDENADHSGLE